MRISIVSGHGSIILFMTNKEQFDTAMRKVLSVSKVEMKQRIEAEKNTPRVGKKRGPKPVASRALDVSVQN